MDGPWCFVFCCVLLSWTVAIPCGPGRLCKCNVHDSNSHGKMDCSHTGLHLALICSTLDNTTGVKSVELDASYNNMTVLTRPSLTGCENVSVLLLTNNKLTFLHGDTFVDLKNLTVLDMSDNNLTSIYYNKSTPAIGTIRTLTTLALHGNFKLRPDGNYSYPHLSNLSDLENLSMDGLYHTSFGKEYRCLHRLSSLTLSGNTGVCDMRHFHNTTFVNTPNLQTLDVSNCNLTTIEAGTFQSLRHLKWLDLSVNRQLGFRVVRNITYGLQFTQIDFVNYSTTQNTFGLGTEVRLSDMCYLHNTTLRSLDIGSNKINLLETNVLMVLPPTLHVLYAYDNRFTFAPYLMQCGCLPNLTHVFASHQDKMHLPSDYSNDVPEYKRTLSPFTEECPFLSENYLRNISKHRINCPYISPSQKTFSLPVLPPKLRHIVFSDCNLQYEIPRTPVLPFNNELEQMDLSRNVLYSWRGPIGPFPGLKTLNLSRNYCNVIGEEFFAYVGTLETLDIRRNFIGIPLSHDDKGKIFLPLRNLKNLYAMGNQIKQIPSNAFDALVNLEVLDLSYNIIDELHVSFSNLRNISNLDLSNNALRTLPYELAMHFEHLYTHRNITFSINLRNNRLRCTCNERLFLKWMVKRRQFFIDFNQYTFTDEKEQNMPLLVFLQTVADFDKACHSYAPVIVVCTLSLSVFLSVIISGVIYRNRWKLRYLIYMNKRRFYGYQTLPDEDCQENYRHDVFISYSDDDIRFVLKEIIPNLEEGESGLSLCIHQRDFMPGNAIADNIIGAIESSRKTVVLLTKSFVKRKWCLYEFQMARMESIYSRAEKGCLVVVMLEKVPSKDMPLEMMQWLKDESYIEFTTDEVGYDLFWKNLKAAILNERSVE